MSDAQSIMPIADTRREVADQPQTITRVLTDLHDQIMDLAALLAERNTKRIFPVGSGDSWFAGQMARLAWEEYAGVAAEPLQAYEYATYGHPGVDAQSAVLIISSSGRPTTTWDALDRALASPAYVVGISDKQYDGNPFIEKPPTALVPAALKKGLPAQTTTATIALMIDLAIALGRANGHLSVAQAAAHLAHLRALPEQMGQVLASSDPIAATLAASVSDGRNFALVGGGPSFGVACGGSALLAEGPQVVGLPLTVEEYHHGLRFATIGPDEPVILIAPTGAANSRNLDTAQSVSNWHAQLVAIVDEADTAISPLANTCFTVPAIPEPMSPLLTILPLHILAIHLAETKMAGGYERPSRVP